MHLDPFLYLFDDYIWYLRTVNSQDESTGVGVFLGLLVEVVGDDFPIVVELFGHWSSEELSKL